MAGVAGVAGVAGPATAAAGGLIERNGSVTETLAFITGR